MRRAKVARYRNFVPTTKRQVDEIPRVYPERKIQDPPVPLTDFEEELLDIHQEFMEKVEGSLYNLGCGSQVLGLRKLKFIDASFFPEELHVDGKRKRRKKAENVEMDIEEASDDSEVSKEEEENQEEYEDDASEGDYNAEQYFDGGESGMEEDEGEAIIY